MTEDRMTLVSHTLCPYVQRAAIMLIEKGVPFSRRMIDLGNKPGWFLEISPLGKVPVLLLPDGKPLFESAPICEFIDEVSPGRPMLPDDPAERARHRGWIAFASATLDTIGGFYNSRDREVLEANRRKLVDRFAHLDQSLSVGPYFGGEFFGQVDAAFGPVFRYFDVFDDIEDFRIFDGLENVRAYRRALSERDSIRRAAVEGYPGLLMEFLTRRPGVMRDLALAAA